MGVFCCGGMFVLCVMSAFLLFGVGASSVSSSLCLSSLLNVGMVSIRGRCLKLSGRKRSYHNVFALILAGLKSAVNACCYRCCMLLNAV